jgi:hypothetical protein
MLNEKSQIVRLIEKAFLDRGMEISLTETEREALKISIRVCVDFFFFLKSKEVLMDATAIDVDYIKGTIRSGLDWFFNCVYSFGSVREEKPFTWPRFDNFEVFRETYFDLFQKLLEKSCSSEKRMEYLLELIAMKIVFLGLTF